MAGTQDHCWHTRHVLAHTNCVQSFFGGLSDHGDLVYMHMHFYNQPHKELSLSGGGDTRRVDTRTTASSTTVNFLTVSCTESALVLGTAAAL
jgi:hypothetical protein